jgi:hypothetical protein
MAQRQVALGLLRQRADAVPEDADADVVKIIVHEKRRIPMIVRQSVAAIAAGLAVEQFPAALRRTQAARQLQRHEGRRRPL